MAGAVVVLVDYDWAVVSVPSYMSANARRGLSLLQFKGSGLEARTIREARQMASGSVTAPKIARMNAFFTRHEKNLDTDKARAYLRGESDRPTPAQVSWLLWGGDLGKDRMKARNWARSWLDRNVKKAVSASVRTGLQNKVDEHNEKHGGTASKRVTLGMLTRVFERGVGAYNTNPQSVRPGVTSSDQWAYARVNGFLRAVRTGRFKSGKFDTDLLPKGHPLSTRKNMMQSPQGPSVMGMVPEFSPEIEAKLLEHSDHHSPRHMRLMRELMALGLTFGEAHQRAMAEVGKDDEMKRYGYDDEDKAYGPDYEFRKEIVEEDGKFCVYSEGRGRKFGCFDTMSGAEERLAQIESFSRSLDGLTPKQLIAAHQLTQKATGDDMLDLARSVIEDRLEALGFAPPYTTGDATEKLAALHAVVPFAKAEDRYTLGPVYVPGRVDGHGEFIDSDTLQKAIWDWVRSGDRTIFLQHSEKAAGEMVEILTWPMPIQTSLALPGEDVRKVEFPAETPFMGVVWESWAWNLVKEGKLRGYSIGGKARRVEADLSLSSGNE